MADFHFLDDPSPEQLVDDALRRLSDGESPESIESTRFDFKEDPSKRDGDRIIAGSPHDKPAAKKLAAEVAAMANTRAGGALLVGVNDKTGEVIGASLDPEWLDRTLHDLLGGRVNLRVRPGVHTSDDGTQRPVLAICVEFSVAPIEWDGRVQVRKGKGKVTRPAALGQQARLAQLAFDPSAQPTEVPLESVATGTRDAVYSLLSEHVPGRFGGSSFDDVAAALGVLSRENPAMLNQAGVLLLATRNEPRLDYVFRPVPGATTGAERVNRGGLSLVAEYLEVFAAVQRHNTPTDLIAASGVRQELHSLPRRSAREAIVNGLAHRDWGPLAGRPTVVEHLGTQLRVTSPGGLVDGVTRDNLLTTTSRPRYPTLMTALRNLGLSEAQGIGIDTIHRELITIGADTPEIIATDDSVTVVLTGQEPDPERFAFFTDVTDPATSAGHAAREDVDFALLVHRCLQPATPWVSVSSCAGLLQRTDADTEHSVRRVSRYRSARNAPVFTQMSVPKHTPPTWTLTKSARIQLRVERSPSEIDLAVAHWLEERERISTPDYMAMFGVTQPTANKRLRVYEDSGLVRPSSPTGRGKGFHYILARGQ